MPASYIRVRAVLWAYGRGQTHRQTDTQTRVTTIHFASSTTNAKCNNVCATEFRSQSKSANELIERLKAGASIALATEAQFPPNQEKF